MKNGQIFYIEEVRTKNKTLTTKTMYKKVGASSASITPLEVTSETSTDTNSITDNSETFKNG